MEESKLWEKDKEIGGIADSCYMVNRRKVFWLSFAILGLIADLCLPLVWGLVATVPIGFASWWIAYRSDWF